MKRMKQVLALLLSLALLLAMGGMAEEPAEAVEEAVEAIEEEPEQEPEEPAPEPEEPAEEAPAEPEAEVVEAPEAAPSDEAAEEAPVVEGPIEDYELAQMDANACPDGEHDVDWMNFYYIDDEFCSPRCSICGQSVSPMRHVVQCTNPNYCTRCKSTVNVSENFIFHVDVETVPVDEKYHQDKCKSCGKVVPNTKWEHRVMCDSAQKNVCSDCGATVDAAYLQIEHSPIWEDATFDYKWEYYDEGHHIVRCSKCGEIAIEQRHSVQCGGNGNICSKCNRAVSSSFIEHDYPEFPEYEYDNTMHWIVCPRCGEADIKSMHTASCKDPKTCDICGATNVKIDGRYGLTHNFDYSKVAGSNESAHWYKCKDCGKLNYYSHLAECGDAKGLCTTCGKPTKNVAHYTRYDDPYEHNAKYHWQVCRICGAKTDMDTHWIECSDKSDSPICEICGAVVSRDSDKIHEYVYTYKNATTHTVSCSICGDSFEASHVVACDAKDTSICEDCGHKGTILKEHPSGYYRVTADKHELYCPSCKKVDKLFSGKHTVYCYSGGVCDTCGYKVANPVVQHKFENGACVFCGTELTIEYAAPAQMTVKDKITVKASSPNDKSFIYRSSNASVATVNDKGAITAKKAGTTELTAEGKQSGMKVSCTLTVLPAPTGVRIEKPTKVDYTTDDEAFSLAASVEPADALQSVKWTSSDETVARVSAEGLVTPIGQGKATITAKSEKKGTNGKQRSDTFVLNVEDLHMPANVKIVEKASGPVYVDKDKPLTLHYAMDPVKEGQTASSAVTWSIPKAKERKIATINAETGEITPNKEGSATVKITTQKKGGTGSKPKQLTDTVKITVVDPTKPRTVQINNGEKEIPLYYEAGKTLELKSTIEPATATPGVKWSISSKAQRKIATVDAATGVVTPTGTKFGVVTVKVETTAKKSNKKAATATIKIAVVDPKYPYSVKIIQEDGAELKDGVELKVGQTLKLSAHIEPATATEKTGITWSISKSQKKYATVAQDGTVTGAKAGKTVTVTAKTANGKKATIKIKIVQ